MNQIEFRKLSIHPSYGEPIYSIYHVIENGRSVAMENFRKLDKDTQEQIIALISKMATIKDFKSPKVKNNLKGYNFGEIRPMPHRFFFFRQCGNNIIFFEYRLKKRDSFNDNIYREINEKKERYETEFRRFIQRS